MKFITAFAMLAFAGIANAAPQYYEFQITNIEERFCEWEETGPSSFECISTPVANPVFGNTPTVSVSFYYDADVAGYAFSDPGSITYTNAVTDMIVSVNGFEYTRNNTHVRFNDATASASNGAPAEDALGILGFLFTPPTSTFDITYNDETYTSEDLLMVFAQGATGADFFPDSALDDPTGPSAVPLPSELPPAEADFTLFSLAFDSATAHETFDNQAASRYSIVGEITVVPIPAAAWLFGSGLALLGWLRRR